MLKQCSASDTRTRLAQVAVDEEESGGLELVIEAMRTHPEEELLASRGRCDSIVEAASVYTPTPLF